LAAGVACRGQCDTLRTNGQELRLVYWAFRKSLRC
jgi:hypothetical protein